MRLLVAEDDASLREQLASALTQAGYAVDAAGDGAQAEFLGVLFVQKTFYLFPAIKVEASQVIKAVAMIRMQVRVENMLQRSDACA